MNGTLHGLAPVHVGGGARPWRAVREGMARRGRVTVCTGAGDWPEAMADAPGLRRLLGRDWERYLRTPGAVPRQRFAASRAALKHVAATVLGAEPEELDLAYSLGGRPRLRGLWEIDVSLAHCGDLIAVGVSRTGRIGVDVESAGRRVSVQLIAGHICTPAEKRELGTYAEADRAAALLRLWTLKEAYTKALGQGLRLGFTEFGFSPQGELCTPDGAPADGAQWRFGTFRVRGAHLLSVACHGTHTTSRRLEARS